MRRDFVFFATFNLSSANAVKFRESKIFLFGKQVKLLYKKLFQTNHIWLLNSLPHNPYFWRPWERSLWKTLWEKEKMLVTSIFAFFHNVFYPSQIKFSVTFVLSSANAFNIDKPKILSFGNELRQTFEGKVNNLKCHGQISNIFQRMAVLEALVYHKHAHSQTQESRCHVSN